MLERSKEIIPLSISDPEWKLKAVRVIRPYLDRNYSNRLTGAWIDPITTTVNIARDLPEPDNLTAFTYDHLDTTVELLYVKLTVPPKRRIVKFHVSTIGIN